MYLAGRVVRPLRGRLEGVFDTPLPIRDKNLINTYLLNPILGKDGIRHENSQPILDKFSTGRVGRKSIRPSVYPVGGVVRPLRGHLEGVFDTPLPIRGKYLINTYLLNPIRGKDGIPYSIGLPITIHFSGTGVGAYRIRPSVYLAGRVVRPLRGRLEGVCDTPLP